MARGNAMRKGPKVQKRKPGNNGRLLRREAEEAEIQGLEDRIRSECSLRRKRSLKEVSGKGVALTASAFKELPISQRTLQGLEASQFVKMTEIQAGAIPVALGGRDVMGEARTGSGKTLAFLVPVVEKLFRSRWSNLDGLGAAIVSPTRELAYQIFQVLSNIGQQHEISAGCIVGGRAFEEEQKAVANMSVLVATPGRLLQHLDESPGFDASSMLILVIDEADRILDFGFQETMQNILGHLPKERQTLLFSATLHGSVHQLGRAALRSPEVISVHHDAKSRTPDSLKQTFMIMPLEKKVDTLFSFLRSHSQKKIIVFVSTCKQVRFFYEAFYRLKPGPAVMELHGRQSLTKRMLVFQQFMDRERAVCLFCTDIAARGVDFPAVDWVVQVDCPDSVDSYIHRVGRTARYESAGKSALFLLPSEQTFVQRLSKARIEARAIMAKQNKVFSVQPQLASLLAASGDIRHLAQRAFASYFRSVRLMKEKEIFDVQALSKEAFAESLGLAAVPDLGADWEADEDAEQNKMKKKKNQSPLQRLKEKIRLKKQEKKGHALKDEEEADEHSGSKKIGKWERRQRRIAASKAPLEVPEQKAEEDDLLQPVAPRELPEMPVVRKLKLRKDGSAQAGQHTFFSKDGTKRSSELAQLAEELRGEDFGSTGGDRASFLAQVAKDLAARDSSDAQTSRARIHEQHRKRKRKRKAESEGHEAPSPSRSPPRAAREVAKVAKVAKSAPVDVADDLGDLEKQALSKLKGLFS